MSPERKGHPRRKKGGGRYTPPSRHAERIQTPYQLPKFELGMATLPDHYRRYLPGVEQMHRHDLEFIDGLQRKFGILRNDAEPRPRVVKLEEPEFHSAVSDLKTYILDLRRKIDGPLRNLPPNMVLTDVYVALERPRPSNKRITDLSRLFLNLPVVKRRYLETHAQKMTRALPEFTSRITGDSSIPENLAGYFQHVQRVMMSSMEQSLDPDKYQQIDNLAIIMGYKILEVRIPERDQRSFFATFGIPSFIKHLERVISGALTDGVDIAERVRSEFLDTEGTIYRLMRVPLRSIERAQNDIKGKTTEEARKTIAENDYGSGACPAVLPTDSAEINGTQRPIAYEYAVTILRNIPPELLKSAA